MEELDGVSTVAEVPNLSILMDLMYFNEAPNSEFFLRVWTASAV